MTPELTSWTRDLNVRLRRPEVWDLMWRAGGQAQWLGKHAHVRLDVSERSVIGDDAGVWREAQVVSVKDRTRVRMQLSAPTAWGATAASHLSISLTTDGEAWTVVTIEETGIPSERRDEVGRFWNRRLENLESLVARVRSRRQTVRQAVVVVHGIGEQQPGDTLANLVKSGVLADADSAQGSWVKIDRFSDSYELRKVTLEATKDRPTTDVFEFYWAHIIRDTTLNHIASWLQHLLLRWPVPQPLRPLWLVAWIAVLVSAAGTFASLFGYTTAGGLVVAAGFAAALWRLAGEPLALNYIGDAVRYLRPHPDNIAHRQAIRQAGVSLLERLQTSGEYDRVVILGHSLGSVIAYDIVTYAWTLFNARHRRPSRPRFAEVVAVELALAGDTDASACQSIQHEAWRRQRANTQPWLVTDLVTVGSPLTYADFLMAESTESFKQRQRDRVFPTCPPTTETESKTGHRKMTFANSYPDPFRRRNRTFVQFNHGAPFGVTRWTNLYFTVRGRGLGGDIVGGPLAGTFGSWVKDVALAAPARGFAHTWYWLKKAGANEHLTALRDALQLDKREDLLSLMRDIPAFALIDDEHQSRNAPPPRTGSV